MLLKLSVLFLFVFFQESRGSIYDALHHYETLHMDDVKHSIVKRDLDSTHQDIKRLSFSVLGRDFNVHLYPRTGILSNDFKVHTVNGDGKKAEHRVDTNVLYHGHLADEADTHVRATLEHDSLTATISTEEDVYVIEPSWRHFSGDQDSKMIAYRESDLKYNFTGNGPTGFCGHSHHLPEELQEDLEQHRQAWKYSPNAYVNMTAEKQHHRAKRATPKNTCPLLLIADYKFYDSMGRDDVSSTVNYMIGLVDRVDFIFRQSYWSGGLSNYGFVIKEILVHTDSTYVPAGQLHYNMKTASPWDVSDLLTEFSKHDYSSVCLSHLFTHQDFSGGVLGLAYIATPRSYAVGGICSNAYYSGNGQLFLNTGLTTTLNWSRRILTQEADLVTAHELGHNFGAEHDPGTTTCSPDGSQGGKYIMYPAAVSGLEPHNKQFSPCSERFIGPVLQAKANKCFVPSQGSFCGNFQVEDDEECDAGLIGLENNDPCCDKYCYFKSGAICSDANAACCKNCKFAPSGMICREKDDISCLKEAKCRGDTKDCPLSDKADDGTECIEDGECINGNCQPFCEAQGNVSCICPVVSESCYRCCHPLNGDSIEDCHIYTDDIYPTRTMLPDGIPCGNGFCEGGICVKSTQDVIKRFWDVIEDININSIAQFMEDNIVGTVIVLSLVIWVPCSCVVHYVDTKRDKEAEEANKWLHPTNQDLIIKKDKEKVISYYRKPQQHHWHTSRLEMESQI
ncbi:ADAM 17-like protease [Glandiceps talaboti]